MARLRWTLVLIALGIGLPALLIVQRATESLALENAYRHQAVAERVFDEMERSLSDFLLREEARPPSQYAALPERDGGAGPLPAAFRDVEEPFVLGWFSLDGAGESRTLAQPGHGEGHRSALDAALRQALAAGRSLPILEDESESLQEERAELEGPAPGRTQTLGRDAPKGKSLADLDALATAQPAESTPYDVLQNLNRAGSLRSERQSKAAVQRSAKSAQRAKKERAADAYAARAPTLADAGAGAYSSADASAYARADADADADAETLSLAEAEAGSRPAAAPVEMDRLRATAMEKRAQERFADRGARADDAAPPDRAADFREAADEPFDGDSSEPVVDPFVGRTTATGQIVLTRSVWRSGEATRQGVVLDRERLVEWLRGSILRDAGLAEHATLDFLMPASAAPLSDADADADPVQFHYLHRFAEPFDRLLARLEIEPLPGFQTARSLYLLAGLLALALVIGLLAVDRTTRVVVEYAERRSNFVAAVSHELRTPLTAIRMYGEMLRDGLVASDTKRAEYYAAITDESERLSRLIDNVLEFSRLEQKRRPLDLVAGGLEETVRGATEKLRAHVERAGFALDLALDPLRGRVHYDRDAVTQIVFNLIDNALKYACEDEASDETDHATDDILAAESNGARNRPRCQIAVSLRESGESGETVILSVRDSGQGVPADQLRRIFEPFYRIGNELTRTADGTGIGLALVKELAEAMDARVEARCPADGGLEVSVEFTSAA